MNPSTLLVAACLAFVPITRALAWADGGHKTVAIIAWEKLSAPDRAWVADLLKQHPKYEEHFAAPMKEELAADADEATKQRWLFAQASVWPDMVRPPRGSKGENPNAAYHHPLWHYLDIPIFPDDAVRSMFRNVKDNADTAWEPGKPDAELNAIQAIKKANHDLRDTSIPAADRAVMLCWLFHLTGDVHQPCHAAALYYPKKLWSGDRGANGVSIKNLPSRPLHAYWDNLLGSPGTDLNHAADNARALLANGELAAAAEKASAVNVPETWLKESSEDAKKYVYPAPVLKAIGEAKPGFYTKDGEKFFSVYITLDQPDIEKYEADALAVAKQRVTTAGMRLAKAVQAADAK